MPYCNIENDKTRGGRKRESRGAQKQTIGGGMTSMVRERWCRRRAAFVAATAAPPPPHPLSVTFDLI